MLGQAQYLHSFRERPKLRYLLEYENNKVFLQKTNWYIRVQSGKFGDLITADHKVFSEGCESRHNHRYAVVVQDLATQWIQSYPCKTKRLRKRKRAYKSSWSRRGNQKSFTLTILWNSAKLVMIFPGIIVRRHHTDRKQMGLLRALCAEYVNATPQMTRFRGAKVCSKWLHERIDDHNTQSDYKYKSELKSENSITGMLCLRGDDARYRHQ